jgi:hypothetical protein
MRHHKPETFEELLLFFSAEHGSSETLTFTDADGENAVIQARDVSMFSAPLVCVDPSLAPVGDDED